MGVTIHIRASAIGYRDAVVLHDLDLKIHEGERVAILGRSGAGKSTLIGRIYADLGTEAALIPQASALVGALSVFHNVYMGQLDRRSTLRNLRNLVWPLEPEKSEIGKVLDIVGLRDVIFQKAGQLSGGQQQRTSIARAMYNGRQILIGDEPVSALDRVQATDLLDRLAGMHRTLILVLHDIPLALSISTRILAIDRGRIVLDAPSNGLVPADLAPFFGP